MKYLIVFIFLGLFLTTNKVLANAYYELYNQTSNKYYFAELGTAGNDKDCIVAFIKDKQPICSVFLTEKTEIDTQGYVNGFCYDLGEKADIIYWKELRKNTFFNEINWILSKRKEQGMNVRILK